MNIKDEDITVEQALRVLNKDYWDDVRGICEEMKRAVKEGEVTDDETLSDALHEHIDMHQRVIYTHQARIGLCCTNNADACVDYTGEKASSVEVQMYWALLADVEARLGDFDAITEELAEEKEES